MSAIAAPLPTSLAPTTPPPTGVGPRRWKWTREQYYKLGDLGFFQDKRVELINGEIFEVSRLSWPKSLAIENVREVLQAAFAEKVWINSRRPFPVGDSDPLPDVAVIPGRMRDYNDHPRTAFLLVEVADTTLLFDTTTKAELYATANVPEYWVLDLEGKQLHVFRDPVAFPSELGTPGYRFHLTLGPTDTIAPLAAASATITVADLLP